MCTFPMGYKLCTSSISYITHNMIILSLYVTFGHMQRTHRKYLFLISIFLLTAIMQIFLSDKLAFCLHNLSSTRRIPEFVLNPLPAIQKLYDERLPNSIDSHLSTQSGYQDYPAFCALNLPILFCKYNKYRYRDIINKKIVTGIKVSLTQITM